MQAIDMLYELRERLGERASFDEDDWDSPDIGNFWRNDFLVRALQQGNKRFNNKNRWPWLLTLRSNIGLSAGENEIELIDDVDLRRHTRVKLTTTDSSARIVLPTPVDMMVGFQLEQQYVTATEPRWYYVARSVTNVYIPGDDQDTANALRIKLIPTPSQAYTAEFGYYRNPAEMGPHDEPDMPDKYHDAVLAWAEWRAWGRETSAPAEAKAQTAMAVFNELVDEAKDEHKGRMVGEPLQWGGAEPNYREPWPRIQLPVGL